MNKVWRQGEIGGFTIGRQAKVVTLGARAYTRAGTYVAWSTHLSPELAMRLGARLISLAMMEQPDEDEDDESDTC